MSGREFRSQDTEINYYVKHLGRFGLTKEEFEQGKNPYDVAWNFCNQQIMQLSQKMQWHELSSLYYTMAIMSDETNRRSPIELLKQSAYWKLINHREQFKNTGLEYHAKISAAPDSCNACKSQDGQIFTIEQALEIMPIPHKDCSFQLFDHPGFCRCQYLFEMAESSESPKRQSQVSKQSQTAKAPSRLSPKTIVVILASIVAFCVLCLACNWVLQTFYPSAPQPTSSPIPVNTQIIPTPTSPAQTYLDEYGGNIEVYNEIFSLTDCAALQEKFNIASDNNTRAEPGTAEFKWTLGYMTAADERMKFIGCYSP